MAEITVYQKPTCTKCRQLNQLLKDKGISYDAVNYYTDPISKTKLKELVKKMGIPAVELFRKKETIYKELGLSQREINQEEAISLMIEHPDLLQRPIVEKGNKAVLARPIERLEEIL